MIIFFAFFHLTFKFIYILNKTSMYIYNLKGEMENLYSTNLKCKKCKLNKQIDDFHDARRDCVGICKGCIKLLDKEIYLKRRDKMIIEKKKDYCDNKQKYAEKNKKYYDANRTAILEYKAGYYVANREQIIAKFRDQYNNDLEFRLKHVIRRRTREFLSRNSRLNEKDELRYEEMIGCDHDHLVKWFEYNFWVDSHAGINWENYGTLWQIDHVYPLSKVECLASDTFYCSWKNLRPMVSSENASKHDHIDQELIDEQADRVDDFEYFTKRQTTTNKE